MGDAAFVRDARAPPARLAASPSLAPTPSSAGPTGASSSRERASGAASTMDGGLVAARGRNSAAPDVSADASAFSELACAIRGASHGRRLRALARGPVPGGRRGGGGGEEKRWPATRCRRSAGDGVLGVRRSERRAGFVLEASPGPSLNLRALGQATDVSSASSALAKRPLCSEEEARDTQLVVRWWTVRSERLRMIISASKPWRSASPTPVCRRRHRGAVAPNRRVVTRSHTGVRPSHMSDSSVPRLKEHLGDHLIG